MHMRGTFERVETIGECMRERSIARRASGASVPHAGDGRIGRAAERGPGIQHDHSQADAAATNSEAMVPMVARFQTMP